MTRALRWRDGINATFEWGTTPILLLSIGTALIDRAVEGVPPLLQGYFALWAAWNLYYYPSLMQRWSGIAAIAVFVLQAAYFGILVWYRGGIL